MLVVGASGFLGAAIVRAFAEHGVAVRGLIRDPGRASTVKSAGGTPVLGDVRDPASLRHATAGCQSIVHVAAHSSSGNGADDDLREVRVQGTRNLIAAGRANEVRRLVIGSGYWVYRDQPGEITETSPVDPQGESRINFESEEEGRRAGRSGSLGVLVVRPGMVYGDGSWFRGVLEGILDRSYAVIDRGANRWSFVSLADAANGFVAVERHGADGETYDLVDGRPSPWGEFARFVAEGAHAPLPGSISMKEGTERWGLTVAHHLAANRAATGAKIRTLGWWPRADSYRDGLRPVLEALLRGDR